jgi:branched-chain amino acid aminotransferase
LKYAFFKGKIVPFEQAKISIMTHAFNYGTGVFEGIRGYWNAPKNQMFILKMREHYERLFRCAQTLKIKIKPTLKELEKITLELAKRNAYKEDIYIRPLAYKSQEKIGLGLTGIEDDFCLFVAPFGAYLDISKGIRVMISSWRRIPESSMPLGTKITGAYFNSSLAKAEALEKGMDEAILLSQEETVAEGSGENLFLVKDGKFITPPLHEIILPGITRAAIIELAKKELGIKTEERKINLDELYTADELFFCGTGAQVSPIAEVEGKKIKGGKIGPITKKLQEIYFKAARGDDPKYRDWVTPVY